MSVPEGERSSHVNEGGSRTSIACEAYELLEAHDELRKIRLYRRRNGHVTLGVRR